MTNNSQLALDIVRERDVAPKTEPGSHQPRFSKEQEAKNFMFVSTYGLSKRAEDVPAYSPDSRARDTALSKVWRSEPHLAGVVNSVVAIDKNRGWQLTGGRNQVQFYQHVLRNAENGKGWRYWCSLASESFWTTDINAITETEREGIPGRLLNIYHVDPTVCKLNGGPNNELSYTPTGGKEQKWLELARVEDSIGRLVETPADYFRVASLPNVTEEYNGLGFCAVSRCLEMVQIMAAVWEYDQEKLGARAPKGLLLLHNIDQTQWDEAMEARAGKLDSRGDKWFGSVATLASSGVDQLDAKLIALSELPDNFQRQTFIDMNMFLYALAFGYDQTEFWPVNAGIMGRGRETEIQHRKATGKGGLDFALSMQDQLQHQLPDTIHYGIEQRDVEGEILDAELNKHYVDMVVDMYTAQNLADGPLLTKDQALSVLATHTTIIPKSWTEIEEEVVASDTDQNRMNQMREMARELPHITRTAKAFPSEPIQQFIFPSLNGLPPQQTVQFALPTERTVTLWESGEDFFRPVNYRGADVKYRSKSLRITGDDIRRAQAD